MDRPTRGKLSSTWMTISRNAARRSPAAQGFSMPAEWERHEATWLAWPHNPTDWPEKIDTIRWVYGEIIRKVSTGEQVRLLVSSASEERFARTYLERANCDLKKVQFIRYGTNRGWMRDSGPIFVRKQSVLTKRARVETAIVHFHFNAWAKYSDWQR